jgi:hypothetical protein
MKQLLAAVSLAILAGSALAQDMAVYELDRVLEVPPVGSAYELVSVPFSGSVVAYDTGPSTPMTEVHIEIEVCADAESQAFLGCEPYEWSASEVVRNYADMGRWYGLTGGVELALLRRGRVAAGTSDPSFIFGRDGRVFVFQQVLEE